MNIASKLLLTLALMTLAVAARAQSTGTWMVSGGATTLMPSVSSGDMSAPSLPGSKASVSNSTRLFAGITYMLTDNFSLELPITAPFLQDISGDGAVAGIGKLGEVKASPVTLLAQWRFLEPTAAFRPWVGFGLTYNWFYGARTEPILTAITGGTSSNPTTMSVDSKWSATFAVGGTMAIDKNWFVGVAYTYSPLATRTHFSTGQTLDITLNPSTATLSIGRKF